jgi:death-on-curing protein
MSAIRWLTTAEVENLHDELVSKYGGLPGTKNPDMLESALNRPLNKQAYGEQSIPKLAAAYAFGIAQNHPFHDANKRSALAVSETFLDLNGYESKANEEECYNAIVGVASHQINEPELEKWFEKLSVVHTQEYKPPTQDRTQLMHRLNLMTPVIEQQRQQMTYRIGLVNILSKRSQGYER